MISFQEIEALINLHNKNVPLISLYAGAQGNAYSRHDCEVVVKDLIKEKEKELKLLSKEARTSVEKDFEKVRSFIKNDFDWKGKKGLALFSSSANDFWQVYFLPQRVSNILVLDHTAHLRPLLSLFDEYRRTCIVLLDKNKARIFEVFLGEIEEHPVLTGDVSRGVKAGGWKGYEENHIQRHLTEEIHRHFRQISEALLGLLNQHHFEELILGGHQNEFAEFERELHPSLKEKIVARLDLDLHISKDEVLKRALAIQHEMRAQEENGLVMRLLELMGQRKAVTGLLGTLTAFKKGQIHSLVVSREYQISGRKCLKCGFLDQMAGDCPVCKIPLNAIPDLVDDLIEAVIDQGCKVTYVSDNGRTQEWGGVGAILRYKV